MTSFSRQKPLKSKIQKHTIVGKTKFYYRAKSQLKRLKIEKLVWKRSLFDDSWPGVQWISSSKLLVVTSDNKLAWTKHISELKRGFVNKLNLIKRSRFLPRNSLLDLYFKINLPSVTYALPIWGNWTNKNEFDSLESIHYRAVRVIYNLPRDMLSVDVRKTANYKTTKIERALWLAERSVCMRVFKHGCDVNMFCLSRANHARTNLKTFLSLLYLPIPSSAETWKIFTNKLCQFCFRLSWHFKREKSVFWKASFCKTRTDYACKTSCTRLCDW